MKSFIKIILATVITLHSSLNFAEQANLKENKSFNILDLQSQLSQINPFGDLLSQVADASKNLSQSSLELIMKGSQDIQKNVELTLVVIDEIKNGNIKNLNDLQNNAQIQEIVTKLYPFIGPFVLLSFVYSLPVLVLLAYVSADLQNGNFENAKAVLKSLVEN